MTQVGEILPSITQIFQDEFRKCIAKNKHRREPYYVLVTGDWYAGGAQFRLVLSPRDTMPPVMLNTMLFKVDNKSGRIDEIWVLPKDAPVDPSIPLGPVDEGLIKIAPKLPLVYK